VHLAEAVAVFVACVLATPVTDGLVRVGNWSRGAASGCSDSLTMAA
jgi:hypothetical protein